MVLVIVDMILFLSICLGLLIMLLYQLHRIENLQLFYELLNTHELMLLQERYLDFLCDILLIEENDDHFLKILQH